MKTVITTTGHQAPIRTHHQTEENHMEPTGYMLGWILGTIAGGIALLKIDIGGMWDLVVALGISAITGLAGAGGTHLYNILLKQRIAKLFKRKKKR